jgi:GntR family transcriptional regulator, transcriptional repressor for pyruvate dehydrogenase complex
MPAKESPASPRDPASPPSSALFSRLHVGRISGLIVDQIRLLIMDGQLTAGDRLPSERELCERFGVSRVTVREALRTLEANGLVTIKVGARGGAFITTPSSERVGEGIVDLLTLSAITAADVTEARRVFELGFVGLVCQRADDHDIDELLALCDLADEAIEAGTYSMELSAEFHVRIARATHNAAIVMLAQSFRGPMVLSLERAQRAVPLMEPIGVAEHRTFTEAVARRDEDAARAILATHLERTAEGLHAAGDKAVLSTTSV